MGWYSKNQQRRLMLVANGTSYPIGIQGNQWDKLNRIPYTGKFW